MQSFYAIFTRKGFLISILASTAAAILYAIGLTFFVQPIGAYVGGVNGLSQILQQVVSSVSGMKIPLGVFTIMFNIPILIFGWFKVEKRFTVLTIYSVLLNGILLNILGAIPMFVISDDVIINIIFAGLFMGIGIGTALRYGGSLGGIDVIVAYISQKSGKSFGVYAITINFFIVLLAFSIQPDNIEGILITIVLFFMQSLVTNQVHTKHKRFTAFIISDDPTNIVEQIHLRCGRGATVMDAKGTYVNQKKYVIMTVITSYQLYIVRDIIAKYDPQAFVNIVATSEIYGNFINRRTDIPNN